MVNRGVIAVITVFPVINVMDMAVVVERACDISLENRLGGVLKATNTIMALFIILILIMSVMAMIFVMAKLPVMTFWPKIT